jgi:RHS repeat-associated protein
LDFGFTGHYRHTVSNLYLAPYRAYDPTIGRWINRDPLGEPGGLNLYSYVKNEPTRFIDPLGLFLYLDDIRDIWNAEGWTLVDVAWNLEANNGSHANYGGALAHCIFHCLYRRGAGPLASDVLIAIHNWAFENPNNPIPWLADFADQTSPSDRQANDVGRKCASGKQSCLQECLKRYPKITNP